MHEIEGKYMCEANAFYLDENGREELYLSNVDIIEPSAQGGIKLVSIYGEQKLFPGKIARMSLLQHKVVLMKE
jgi:predicted RNA-binding protein